MDFPSPGNVDSIRAITLFTSIIANAVIESHKETGLKIIENLQDEDEELLEGNVSSKSSDEEIVDYSNYTPTEPKEEAEDVADDDLVDEDKLYK
jgi:small subunit ribosomal protein S2